jgi:flagellar hook-associated protein 3 FlgL
MRISTNQIYQAGSSNLMSGQTSLYKLQNQLSTGKKFLSAQDDPVAAAQVLITSQSLAVNTQYADNQANASSQLAYEEGQLDGVVSAIQFARDKVIAAGSGTYTDADRRSIADVLESQAQTILGLANSTDANGYYLFSGYQGSRRPFETAADGSVSYAGDDGQRRLQVGSERELSVADSGHDVFERVRSGNGTYAAKSGSANSGTGIMDAGSLVSLSAWSAAAQNYSIEFTSATQFEIKDKDGNPITGSPFSYTAGAAITAIAGVSFSISGTPQGGDTFSIGPSSNQNVFTTLKNLVTALRTNVDGNPAAGAAFRNTLNGELQNLDQALENVSGIRSNVGSRMTELESLQGVSSTLGLQFQAQISGLQDIDYAAAMSAFVQQKTQLDAAQSSFAKIAGLSLFSYL